MVEQSPGVKALGENLKKVEAMLSLETARGQRKTVFLKAKSSIPREPDKFFGEVRNKMLHSLAWWSMALAGRHASIAEELPDVFNTSESQLGQIDLVLVIPNIPDNHVAPCTDKFRTLLQGDARAWGISLESIKVLNYSKAQRYGILPQQQPNAVTE